MPEVHFYLKKPEGNPPASLIYLQFKYKGRRLVYSVGQKINPLDWSKEKKRVKSNRETILNGLYGFNEYLDELRNTCIQCYREESLKGIPSVAVLRYRLDAFARKKLDGATDPGIYRLFDRFIAGEFMQDGKHMGDHALKNYATTKGHLVAFDVSRCYHIDFGKINLDFFQRYTAFLRDELCLKPNSIARDIGVLKTVMSKAVDSGYTANIQWRHRGFSCRGEEAEVVCLTEKEAAGLYRHDLSGEKRLEQVRDLFVLACCMGLRYEDIPSVRSRQFIRAGEDLFCHMPAEKGREALLIPCNPIVLEILKKYEIRRQKLPQMPSNQKFNDYIKEACYWSGLTVKGRLAADPAVELWQCISSGTARRSFAAHYYHAGYPVTELMKITGHRSEKAFLQFIRAAGPHAGRRPDEYAKRQWLLKVLKALTLPSGNKYSR